MPRVPARTPHLGCLLLACAALLFAPPAVALDPALDVSQYAHTSWKIRDGFVKGGIEAIAQTPDGYLWLGTQFGLYRFDGVRAVPWQPPAGEHLASSRIRSLLAARDGTLWIGTNQGLASWKDGRLTQYPELAEQGVLALFEDHERTVWAGAYWNPVGSGRLCAIQTNSVQCYGEGGSLGRGVGPIYEDSRGNLWFGGTNGLWRWKPGPPRLYSIPGSRLGIYGLTQVDNQTLLVLTADGMIQFIDGRASAYPLLPAAQQLKPARLLRDRDGGLWIGTLNQGLVHVHQGRVDTFGQADGLSGNFVPSLFEDREGNIWVATIDGLDRFHNYTVATVSVKQGLSNSTVESVLAALDGSVWLGTLDGLNRRSEGKIAIYRKRNGLPDDAIGSLFQDHLGRLWASTNRGIAYLENGRFVPLSGVPARPTQSMAGDSAGNLWVSQVQSLSHLLSDRMVEQIPWDRLGHTDYASALLPDRFHGGLWLGFYQGGVTYFKDGQVHSAYGGAEGLTEGRVHDLRLDPDGALWASTEGGLSRAKNGRVATLTSKNGLPCDAVHWSMEDNEHSLWLYTACGLVRIERDDLDAWISDSKRSVPSTVFDSSDGVRSNVTNTGSYPMVAKSADGRLWFLPFDGVSVIDPSHLAYNKLSPPVHVEQIVADGKTYWQNWSSDAPSSPAKLPPLVRDLTIDYTALSLVAPERVLFQYKLEGFDGDWQNAGNRRQAFYTNLPPKKYTFRVKACNNSGVWNEEGAALDFVIAPAYYQTNWFRVLCVATFAALLWGLHQLRLRRLAWQFNTRLEERVNERTRIARDLHDTMLQSFQGTLLKFYALSVMLADRPEAQQELEGLVDQGQQAINEGREVVQGLRSSTVIANDLARAFTTLGEELAAKQNSCNPVAFQVEAQGETRDLHPILRDEVYRIGCEALRNAFQHSGAARIEVGIHYDDRQFRVCIQDNGKGIDPSVLGAGSRERHYGLPGMHERAESAGGRLVVRSRVNSGTEVEIIIPAARAYAKSHSPRRSAFLRRGA